MATAAAALTARARRHIQHVFFSADAVRPDRAVAFEPQNGFERRQFEELRSGGAIHESQPGRYWLDLPAFDRLTQQRFGRLRIALALVALIALAVGLLGINGAFP
ncbi:hypothetical protein [Sphingomonas humi]|uniref:Uncharacterized protein n=1 Tax=Sphingomonas humi TaxID=335630 RepID=A0ABP7S4I9_9SPHN